MLLFDKEGAELAVIYFRLVGAEIEYLFFQGLDLLILGHAFGQHEISFGGGFSYYIFSIFFEGVELLLKAIDLMFICFYKDIFIFFLRFIDFLIGLCEFDSFVGEFFFHFFDDFGLFFAIFFDGDDIVFGFIYFFEPKQLSLKVLTSHQLELFFLFYFYFIDAFVVTD